MWCASVNLTGLKRSCQWPCWMAKIAVLGIMPLFKPSETMSCVAIHQRVLTICALIIPWAEAWTGTNWSHWEFWFLPELPIVNRACVDACADLKWKLTVIFFMDEFFSGYGACVYFGQTMQTKRANSTPSSKLWSSAPKVLRTILFWRLLKNSITWKTPPGVSAWLVVRAMNAPRMARPDLSSFLKAESVTAQTVSSGFVSDKYVSLNGLR